MKLLLTFLLCAIPVAVLFPALSFSAAADAKPVPTMSGSLAGLKIGMDKDDAEAALTAAGASSAGKKDADDDKDKPGAQDKPGTQNKPGDPDQAVPEVWTLKNSPYARVVFAADDSDKVLWVTAFARPGQDVPFAQIGSLARAAASGPAFAVWNIISPRGSFREIARGQGGKARVVSLLPLKSVNPNGAFSPQVMPKQAMPKSASQLPAAESPK